MYPKRFVLLCLLSLLALAGMVHANVPYRVTGVLKVHEKEVTLNMADGRLFLLENLSPKRYAKWDETIVTVEGLARQADQIGVLKVKKIERGEIDSGKIVLPPFKDFQRPPKLLKSHGSHFTIGDFRWGPIPGHADKFRHERAVIDVSKVEKAYFALKPFPPEWIAGHSLFVFKMKPGGVVNSKGEEAQALVLSIEAHQRTDQKYSIKKGLKNTFGVTWILATWEDYSEITCADSDRKLYLFPIRFDQAQTATLLQETITQATRNRAGEFYNTITNNCTNNLVVLMNRVLPPQKRIRMWWLPSMVYNLRATMPVLVPKMLIKKGYLGKDRLELGKSNFRNPLP